LVYEESLALAREYGEPFVLARPLAGLGKVAWALGDHDAARSYFEEAVEPLRDQDDPFVCLYLDDLGMIAYEQGDLVRAERAFEESLAIGRDRDIPNHTLLRLGRVAWYRGELKLARRRGEESLGIAEEKADREAISRALLLLGLVSQTEGDSATARSLLRRSLRLCQELAWGREPLEWHPEAPEQLEALAAVDQAQGQLLRAARLLGAASTLRETHGPPVPPIDRADWEQQVAAVRVALGEEAFAAAWAAGRAMSLEEALAFALKDNIPSEGPE
jgi:tetratricopeptide (TPR) repeat protein